MDNNGNIWVRWGLKEERELRGTAETHTDHRLPGMVSNLLPINNSVLPRTPLSSSPDK